MRTQSAFIELLDNIFRVGSYICETSLHVFKIWQTHLGSWHILKGVGKENEKHTQIIGAVLPLQFYLPWNVEKLGHGG